jgi:leucyl-tRNA synthetase
VLLLAPFAPHIAEELWSLLGHGGSLAYVTWPGFDPELARDEQRAFAVQLNGKVRHKVLADPDLDSAALLETMKADPRVADLFRGAEDALIHDRSWRRSRLRGRVRAVQDRIPLKPSVGLVACGAGERRAFPIVG